MKRVMIWMFLVLGCPTISHAQLLTEATSDRLEQGITTAPEMPTLFESLKLRATELLEGSFDIQDKGARVTYAPFIYGSSRYYEVFSETRLTVAQKEGLTTLGVGMLYNPVSPRGARGKALWTTTADPDNTNAKTIVEIYSRLAELNGRLNELLARVQAGTATPDDHTLLARTNAVIQSNTVAVTGLLEAETKRIQARLLRYDTALAFTPIPLLGVNYNTTFFKVLGGSFVDADNDTLDDNGERVKKHSLGFSGDIRPSLRFALSSLLALEWERSGAEHATPFATFVGYGVTASGIIAILNADYETSEDFLKSLFVSSVVVGGALEGRRCQEEAALCPEGTTSEVTFTPFVDLKITPTAQFRIGVPFKRISKTDATTTEVAAIATYTLQLGAPK